MLEALRRSDDPGLDPALLGASNAIDQPVRRRRQRWPHHVMRWAVRVFWFAVCGALALRILADVLS